MNVPATHPRWLIVLLLLAGCRSPSSIERPDTEVTQPDAVVGDVSLDLVLDLASESDVPEIADPDAMDEPDVPQDLGTPIARACSVTFTLPAARAATSVTVPGEWNAWDRNAHPMTNDGGNWTVTLENGTIPVGEWGYKFCIDGCTSDPNWQLDPANPLVKYVGNDAIENSKVVVPDCERPLLELVSASADWATKSVSVVVQVRTGVSEQPLTPGSLRVELQGVPVQDIGFDPDTQTFNVALTDLEPGKYSFVFFVANSSGEALPLFVPVWLEERPFAWQDAVLYFAMTDRWFDGNPGNGNPAACIASDSPANWMGGDFAGLTQKIEEGYFTDLGINALWISAVNDNPNGCYVGELGYQYTSYHGYFPISLDQTEDHFGTIDELKALVQAAHRRGIRVIMDLAANHMHEESPLWTDHKDWFFGNLLLCEDADHWDTHPIDCWFQPYLPDLDYRNNDAVNAMTDAAIEWVRVADFDGFRVDAVKHMVHNFGRTLRHKVRTQLENSGVPFYLVGETFVGDWGGGTGLNETLIKDYISDRELNGQFDFPLYWEIVKVLARGEGDTGRMARLAEVTSQSLTYYGTNAIMSRFLGNHDVARFISHAVPGVIADQWSNGAKEVGWSNPPPLPTNPEAFSRLIAGFGFILSLPGVPLVYYGDEIGMPGAGDPDNRRMMQFDGLSAEQVRVKTALTSLIAARADHPAMRSGTFALLFSDAQGMAFAVSTASDAILTVLNMGGARTIVANVTAIAALSGASQLTDAISGTLVPVLSGSVSVPMPAFGTMVLTP